MLFKSDHKHNINNMQKFTKALIVFLHCITHNNIPDTVLTINISINAAVVTMTTVFIFVECSVIVNQTKQIQNLAMSGMMQI